jgi:molecular chaperone DnaJ
MVRNYYVTLGVPPNASPEEIREAYRRLVKASHPDVSGAESGACFREVQEAWETLRDAERRRNYDATLKRVQPSRPLASAPEGRYHSRYSSKASALDPFGGFINEPDGAYVSTARGQELHFGLHMTAAEAATGGEMPLRVPVQARCPQCAGSGSYFLFLCPACRGNGYRSYWRTVTLRVPAGLRNGNTLEVPLAQLGSPRARLILHVELDQEEY